MEIIKLQSFPDGTYFTDPFITKEEWFSVLKAAEKDGKHQQLDTLLLFFRMPGHTGTCYDVGKLYGMDYSSVRSLITNFGTFTQKALGNRFKIEDVAGSENRYWPIPMLGKKLSKDRFQWTLRPELVDAIREMLLDKLMTAYRERILAEGLDNQYSDELYKWKLLAECKGKSDLEVIKLMPSMNLITWRTAASLRKMLDVEPEETLRVFSILKDPNRRFADKFKEYKTETKKLIVGEIRNNIDNDRTAALFLACLDPAKNAVYKYDLYDTFCDYLGYSVKGGAGNYEHYVQLLQPIIEREQADAELTAKLHTETDSYFWSDLLNAQDVLWQMQFMMRSSRPRNWLQQIYDNAIASKQWAFTGWYPNYKKNVQLFTSMFEEGKTAEDVDEATKDLFIRKINNEICDITSRGVYPGKDYPKVLALWPDIFDVLKRNYTQGFISRKDYDDLDKTIRSVLTGKSRPAAYRRLWAGVFPEYLTTIVADDIFRVVYDWVRSYDSSLPKYTGHWLDDNLALMDYFHTKVIFKEPEHRSLFAWYLASISSSLNDNDSIMNEYIELLKANYNLVLTGAPGTGKTFLAKQIACSLVLGKTDFKNLTVEELEFFDKHCKQVQFHPSYDYSDFVEGLRPVKRTMDSQIVFQREDGIMKKLCSDAVTNLQAASKSPSELEEEKSIKQKVSDFFDDAINNERTYATKNNKKFSIDSVDENAFYVLAHDVGDDLIRVPLKDLYQLMEMDEPDKVTDIRSLLGRKRRQQGDSYLYSILKQMNSAFLSLNAYMANVAENDQETVKEENFVLIIDEINRGELSKIFGELFYAIEPGYRGESGKVQTQYQNLVEEDDVFYDGFYVPKNVFIIGTMNDIDRGVESMDFAVRRRFAWYEVKVDKRVNMLNEEISDWAEPAKKRMEALNTALKDNRIGLTDAYDIGPAYFLKLKKYNGDFDKLWEYHLKGVLFEYLRGKRDPEEKLNFLKAAYDNA